MADDVVTSIKAYARSKKKNDGGRDAIREISGYRDYRDGKSATIPGLRPDGKRISIELDRSYCPFPALWLLNPPLPTHVFGRYISDADPSMNADEAPEHLAPPVGSGPFLFKEWRRGDEIVLAANERYWRGRPLLDELAFRILTPPTGTAPFRSGAVHLEFGGVHLYDIAHELEGDPAVAVLRTASPGYTFIGWNTRSQTAPALQDKRIRQALAYGFDVDLAIRRILDGEGARIRQHMDSTSWARTDGLNEYAFDPAMAEALIRSAGYGKGADGIYEKDGRPLAFTLVTNDNNPVRAKILQFAVDQYRAIGVRVTPQRVTFGSLVQRVTDGDPSLEAFILGWTYRADPFGAFVWRSSGRLSGGSVGYGNVVVDRAVDGFLSEADCSIAARKRAFDIVNRALNDDQPYNFLFQSNTVFVVSRRVRGFIPGSYVPAPDSHLWWLAPEKK